MILTYTIANVFVQDLHIHTGTRSDSRDKIRDVHAHKTNNTLKNIFEITWTQNTTVHEDTLLFCRVNNQLPKHHQFFSALFCFNNKNLVIKACHKICLLLVCHDNMQTWLKTYIFHTEEVRIPFWTTLVNK